jgi:hypothetical protein
MAGEQPVSTAELFQLDGAPVTVRRRPRREPYFEAYWTEPGSGERLGRATRIELREAYRLLSKHRDVAEGCAA